MRRINSADHDMLMESSSENAYANPRGPPIPVPERVETTMQHPKIFVGTVGEGVWRSTDGGASFERASDGMFVECDVRALVVDPRNPQVLYAGTNEGVYRTANGAGDWTRLEGPLDDLIPWSLLVVPPQPETLLAATR